MRRLCYCLVLLAGCASLAVSKQPPPVPAPMPNAAVVINSLASGGTYTNPLTVSGVYAPDPPPGDIMLYIQDSNGVGWYDAGVVYANGTFTQTANAGPPGVYTVQVYIKNSTAFDSVTINVK